MINFSIRDRHDSTLLHTIIEDFLKHCDDGDREEILALIRPAIDKYLITKQSVLIGIMCIWHGNKKVFHSYPNKREGRLQNQTLFTQLFVVLAGTLK